MERPKRDVGLRSHSPRGRGPAMAPIGVPGHVLRAIRQGDIDAPVVEGTGGNKVYTLHGAEEPYRTLVEQMQEGAVLTCRGDILYSNARFAAPAGGATPVCGWQSFRPICERVRQRRFRDPARCRQKASQQRTA